MHVYLCLCASNHAPLLIGTIQAEAMPDLINLRIFSNVLFFIGRSLAGEDTIEAFTKRARMYAGTRMCLAREGEGGGVRRGGCWERNGAWGSGKRQVRKQCMWGGKSMQAWPDVPAVIS